MRLRFMGDEDGESMARHLGSTDINPSRGELTLGCRPAETGIVEMADGSMQHVPAPRQPGDRLGLDQCR